MFSIVTFQLMMLDFAPQRMSVSLVMLILKLKVI